MFRRKTDRFRSSLSSFSRIAGLFRGCLPKSNIVAPFKEDDSEMLQDSNHSPAKEINSRIIGLFKSVRSTQKSSEEFEEEWEARRQKVRSKEATKEIDDEELFKDDEPCENSGISLLSSERIENGKSFVVATRFNSTLL